MQNAPLREGVPPEVLHKLLRESLDVVFVLDAEHRIEDVLSSIELGRMEIAGMLMSPFEELVSFESLPKLPAIFASNVVVAGSPVGWRHINLMLPDARELPILAKYAEFQVEGRLLRCILGRDLTGPSRMQKRLLIAQQEMHQTTLNVHAERSAEHFRQMLALSIGRKPYQQIVAESLAMLERLCVKEALHRSQGDPRLASLLLGLSPDEFQKLQGEPAET